MGRDAIEAGTNLVPVSAIHLSLYDSLETVSMCFQLSHYDALPDILFCLGCCSEARSEDFCYFCWVVGRAFCAEVILVHCLLRSGKAFASI